MGGRMTNAECRMTKQIQMNECQKSHAGWVDSARIRQQRPPRPTFDLEERTARFGEAVVAFAKTVARNAGHSNASLAKWSVPATSVGANYCEADDAGSKKEFCYRISLCKRESRESKHWLRMLAAAVPNRKDEISPFWREAKELNLIFVSHPPPKHGSRGHGTGERPDVVRYAFSLSSFSFRHCFDIRHSTFTLRPRTFFMTPLRIAMLGTGFMGRAHSNAWRQVSHFFPVKHKPVLQVCCGREDSTDKTKKFAENWGYESSKPIGRRLSPAMISIWSISASPTICTKKSCWPRPRPAR